MIDTQHGVHKSRQGGVDRRCQLRIELQRRQDCGGVGAGLQRGGDLCGDGRQTGGQAGLAQQGGDGATGNGGQAAKHDRVGQQRAEVTECRTRGAQIRGRREQRGQLFGERGAQGGIGGQGADHGGGRRAQRLRHGGVAQQFGGSDAEGGADRGLDLCTVPKAGDCGLEDCTGVGAGHQGADDLTGASRQRAGDPGLAEERADGRARGGGQSVEEVGVGQQSGQRIIDCDADGGGSGATGRGRTDQNAELIADQGADGGTARQVPDDGGGGGAECLRDGGVFQQRGGRIPERRAAELAAGDVDDRHVAGHQARQRVEQWGRRPRDRAEEGVDRTGEGRVGGIAERDLNRAGHCTADRTADLLRYTKVVELQGRLLGDERADGGIRGQLGELRAHRAVEDPVGGTVGHQGSDDIRDGCGGDEAAHLPLEDSLVLIHQADDRRIR